MMGTTQTPILGLIKPDTNESMKDWPWQNLINCMKLDNKVKVRAHEWSPKLQAATDPTMGTGAVEEGFYLRLSNKIIIAFGVFVFGSGMNPGSGTYFVELPKPVDTSIHISEGGVAFDTIGRFVWEDESGATANLVGACDLTSDREIRFLYGYGSGDEIQHDQPAVQEFEDKLSFYVMYQEADL